MAARVRQLIEDTRKRELDFELAKGRMSAVAAGIKDNRDRTLAMYNTYAKDERIANAVTVKTGVPESSGACLSTAQTIRLARRTWPPCFRL